MLSMDFSSFKDRTHKGVTPLGSKDDESLIEQLRTEVTAALSSITVAEYQYKYKTFKNISMQTLVSSTVKSILFTHQLNESLFMGLQRLKDNKLGHLIVVEKDLSQVVGIVSKLDFLIYVIKGFISTEEVDQFLQRPILQLQIGTSGADIQTMSQDILLRNILTEVSSNKYSCVPVVDQEGKLIGVIQKWHILHVFKSLSFLYVRANMSQTKLDLPVSKFFEYLKTVKQASLEKGVAFIEKEDTFRDVIQKFVFSRGQAIYLDEEGRCQGLITLTDIINYLI